MNCHQFSKKSDILKLNQDEENIIITVSFVYFHAELLNHAQTAALNFYNTHTSV